MLNNYLEVANTIENKMLERLTKTTNEKQNDCDECTQLTNPFEEIADALFTKRLILPDAENTSGRNVWIPEAVTPPRVTAETDGVHLRGVAIYTPKEARDLAGILLNAANASERLANEKA